MNKNRLVLTITAFAFTITSRLKPQFFLEQKVLDSILWARRRGQVVT